MQPEEQRRAKGTSWKNVYDSVREGIMSLELEPGQPLDETTLAERYDVSRSPVREALIRLAADELVITLPNRSTIVAPIYMDAFPKYVEALDVARRMNCRLAAALRTDEDIGNLESKKREFENAVQAHDHLAMTRTNAAFHLAIADAGRNPYLISFYGRLLDLGRRIHHLHFKYLERQGEGVTLSKEHASLIGAIRKRDKAGVVELAQRHTLQFRDDVICLLSENHLAGEPV